MEQCRICKSYNVETKYLARDRNWHTTDQQFAIVECSSCGILQTFPQPDPSMLASYYPQLYYPTSESSESYYKKFIQRFQRDKVDKIRRRRTTGRILDIGCGVGYFMREAIDAGYEAEGIDFSETASIVGKERLSVKVAVGEFLEYPYKDESFDIVTLWQAFEHFYQPVEALRKIHRILRPGGLLVIAVPNIESIQAKIFRARWYHLEIPRHLFHYSPRSLSKLVEQFGFKAKSVDFYSREHNGYGVLGSIIRFPASKESFPHKLFRKIVGRYVSDLIASVESAIGRGGTFTLFAVRP